MRQKPRVPNRSSEEKHLINENIKSSQVRLIGLDGEQLGVLSLKDALNLAEEKSVDLVQVADNVSPPVCKLLDYGKLKYREQKKAAEARRKTAVNTIKEIRVRYSTDQHDLDTKVKSAKKFIENGDKVRFQMRFRGREVVYRDLGEEVFKKIAELLEDVSMVEEFSSMQGNKMTMVIAPKTSSSK